MEAVKKRALERLRELLEEAQDARYDWSESGRFTKWERAVKAALRRLFGAESDHLKTFEQISYSPMILTSSTTDSVWSETFHSGMTRARAVVASAIQEVEDYELPASNGDLSEAPAPAPASGRKVFVVHGHDSEMKEAVARFLERLDFEAVILHEQPNSGSTIIEKFERHSDVSYAVVLLSPDDVGASKGEADKLQPRARQNVVLELGYFIGRLGRNRVCPIVRSKLEIPSDFAGVVYLPYDGGWKMSIVSELKALGYDVDANKAF